MTIVRFITIFRFSYFGQNDQKQKNQLYCLCLKVTVDFRNFIAKIDEKRKTKDEMNQTKVPKRNQVWVLKVYFPK